MSVSSSSACVASQPKMQCGTIPFPVDSSGVIPAGYEGIDFEMITNDGQDDSLIKLIAFKTIISTHLPNMPREYIVRLLFDYRHYSFVVRKDGVVFGGICFRPYFEQRFGEIAFCVISSSYQVKGFGSILMNMLKSFVQPLRLEYMLAYADNTALDYFYKQGFSSSITMPTERYVGYIKDYVGSKLMECYIHPAVDYRLVRSMIRQQKEFIVQRVKSRHVASEKVYDGMSCFREGKRLRSVLDIDGVEDSPWRKQFANLRGNDRLSNAQSRVTASLMSIWTKVEFLKGFSHLRNVPEEFLTTDRIYKQLSSGDYYRSKDAFFADWVRVVAIARKELSPLSSDKETDLNEFVAKLSELCTARDP